MPTIQLNNANFYYELHGKGAPLILIAGYTCDYSSWQLMMEDLSKQFQVLVFDNRGIGQTTDANEPLSIKQMANDVMALADHLRLEKPHIAGQSMGGTIGQTIAAHFPDKINKLCLLTTSAKWRQAMLRGLKSLLMMREKNIEFDLVFESTLPWIFGETFLQNKEIVAGFKKLLLENPHPQSLSDQTRQFNVLLDFDGREQLEKIKSSTLIVHGKQDIISLPEESHYLAKHISKAALVELDCAHGIMLEKPKELADTLIHFLKRE